MGGREPNRLGGVLTHGGKEKSCVRIRGGGGFRGQADGAAGLLRKKGQGPQQDALDGGSSLALVEGYVRVLGRI